MATTQTKVFFLLILCALLFVGGSNGNGEGQYEYEARVELTPKENKNHIGILWTYLTDFESYKSVHRFIGEK